MSVMDDFTDAKGGLVFFGLNVKQSVFKLDDIIAPPPSRPWRAEDVFGEVKKTLYFYRMTYLASE